MLEQLGENHVLEKTLWKQMAPELKKRLGILQQQVRTLKIPVVIVFEGWGASGKGSTINRLIQALDPRGFSVYSILPATADEQRYPWMKRYWEKLPAYGDFSLFDRSWYQDVAIYAYDGLEEQERECRITEIEDFEEQMTNDGTVLVKFFLHISKKEQKRRFKALSHNESTAWRVTKEDWRRHKHYWTYYQRFDSLFARTDNENAQWTLVDATDSRYVTHKVFTTVIAALASAIAKKQQTSKMAMSVVQPIIRHSGFIVPQPIARLCEVTPYQEMEETAYKEELKRLQKRLFQLHNAFYQRKIPMILAYEGWDAAGKGGNIRRLTNALDPRGYQVIPIAAPSPEEKNHQHLWRFWKSLPRDGHIAIYDRTWYGRCMVEKIEGFCTPEQWARSYDEINHFERQLVHWGAVLRKFWLHISPQEQLKRFTARQNTPEKRYKITDEDWRNREKWQDYEVAVDEMLARTNTTYAPWTIVESDNKKYARIKTLRAIVQAMEEAL